MSRTHDQHSNALLSFTFSIVKHEVNLEPGRHGLRKGYRALSPCNANRLWNCTKRRANCGKTKRAILLHQYCVGKVATQLQFQMYAPAFYRKALNDRNAGRVRWCVSVCGESRDRHRLSCNCHLGLTVGLKGSARGVVWQRG